MGIVMITEARNHWAQYLEEATQKEIRQMAEYAIDHLENADDLAKLSEYLDISIADDAPSIWNTAA